MLRCVIYVDVFREYVFRGYNVVCEYLYLCQDVLGEKVLRVDVLGEEVLCQDMVK